MRYFYVDSARQSVGPISRQQLDLLTQQGAIHGETLVVPEGGQAWVALRTLAPEPATAAVPRPAAVVPPPMRAPTPATRSHVAPQPQPVAAVPVSRPISGPVSGPVTTAASTDGNLVDGIKAAFTNPHDLGQRLIAFGGAVGVVGFILPWAAAGGSISGWSLATKIDGRIFVALAVAISAIVISGYLHHADVAKSHRLARIPIILGTAGLMIAYAVTSIMSFLPSGSIGIGMWLTCGSLGAQLIGGWIVIGKEPLRS